MGKIFFPVSAPKKINRISELFWFWTFNVSRQHLMKSLLSVCPSICPSANPSLRFVKIVSLVFSDIVYHDSWSWYLEVRFLKKKYWQPKFGPNGPKSGLNLGFLPFSQFRFICFPWIYIQWQLATISNF